ncbi:hypothetical protein DFQ28_000231 [Apophysomyces sp. BC1034]|nr:hypothetical protein DFQ30_001384 [Apophysomyces sp. BC1015]KAG0180982.1 hypothetical protein DFQ29_009670 [Apophysomyces sp. BC1021]KAG0191409.1 hypothetical protein DFQ28_000231 [Apophysomyces sp. BC1034]
MSTSKKRETADDDDDFQLQPKIKSKPRLGNSGVVKGKGKAIAIFDDFQEDLSSSQPTFTVKDYYDTLEPADLYRAHHDYEAQQEDELTLKDGDIIHVKNTDNQDWWFAEKQETGESGMVPSNFLQQVGGATPLQTQNAVTGAGPILARVIEDYEAQTSHELALWKNGVVAVLDQNVGDNYWKGDLNGKIGVFPAKCVKVIEAHEEMEATTEDGDPGSRHGFKLAAYGVKQGGIGSILAGGFLSRKKTARRTSTIDTEKLPEDHAAPQVPTTPQVPTIPKSENIDNRGGDDSVKALVLHDYEPVNEDEIKLMRGEYVAIIDKMDDQGWWKGLNEKGAVGVFPSNFVQIMEEQHPPARPPRARPPTIKPETSTPVNEPLMSPTLARPPPVPVSTRPSSLLSNRSSAASEQTPTTGPPTPPRPVTSPPLASRSMIIQETKRHKPRVPSVHTIPMVAPDLPPITSHGDHPEHPTRPSRPVPAPAPTVSTNSVGSEAATSRKADLNKPPIHLAKPPKIKPFTGKDYILAAPGSLATKAPGESEIPVVPERKSNIEPPLSPPIPKRAMPRPPPLAAPLNEEPVAAEAVPVEEEAMSIESMSSPNQSRQSSIALSNQAPPVPSRSPPTVSSTRFSEPPMDTSKATPPPRPAMPPPDSLEVKIRSIVKKETEKIRQEFESLLQTERNERQRLENELRELKNRL